MKEQNNTSTPPIRLHDVEGDDFALQSLNEHITSQQTDCMQHVWRDCSRLAMKYHADERTTHVSFLCIDAWCAYVLQD
jgi:hypothetical protein